MLLINNLTYSVATEHPNLRRSLHERYQDLAEQAALSCRPHSKCSCRRSCRHCLQTVTIIFSKASFTKSIHQSTIYFLVTSIKWQMGSKVVHFARHRIRDHEAAGSSLSWVPLGSNHGQVIYTSVPLSPSSIIWYRPNGWEVNRHTTRCTSPKSVVSPCN